MGCCALLGNVGADGLAEGASKFGPEKDGKRVQGEFAPICRCFVEKASHFLDDVGKEQSWFTGLFKAQKGGKSLAPLWPQTPPCPSSDTARAGGENHLLQHDAAFLRSLRHRYHGEVVRISQVVGIYFSARFCCISSCPLPLQLWRKKKKKRDAEGKFVDVETMTKNTLTMAIDKFEQTVIAVKQWRQNLPEARSSEPFFDNGFNIHFEKFAQIYKTAVGQFGALTVEGCTLAKGTKTRLDAHLHSPELSTQNRI